MRCPRSSRLRRHLPFALFVVALGGLVIALARPVAIVSVPANKTTVILTIDVSGSMCSTDIDPTRLLAAEAAAGAFVQRQASTTQIGIVAFSGFAEVVQPPTNDQEAPARRDPEPHDGPADGDRERDPGRDRRDQRGGSIGRPEPDRRPARRRRRRRCRRAPMPPTSSSSSPTASATPGPIRSMPPSRPPTAASGSTRSGSGRPMAASFAAACAQQFLGREPQGGGGFGGGSGGGAPGGGGFRRGIDDATLKQVADLTGGSYYPAESAGELRRGAPGVADVAHHQARGRRGRRRVRGGQPRPGCARLPARPGLATSALTRRRNALSAAGRS